MPNSELTKSTVHNLTYPAPQMRVRVDVRVGYNTDITKVREVMIHEANRYEKVIDKPAPYFAFLSFGDSALDVALFLPGESFRGAVGNRL